MARRSYARRTMMRSRGARIGRGLTGGTGDVNPQWLNLNTIVGAIAAQQGILSTATPIPINQVPAKASASLVLEILKVQFEKRFVAAGDGGAGAHMLTFKNLAVGAATVLTDWNVSNSHTIAYAPGDSEIPAAAGVEGKAVVLTTIDLTDGAGHGVIFAGQNIFHGFMAETACGASQTLACRILFRWKYVTMTEYVGLVTSQLSA